jgi:hypothetical protein
MEVIMFAIDVSYISVFLFSYLPAYPVALVVGSSGPITFYSKVDFF